MIKERNISIKINNNTLKYYSKKLNMDLVIGQNIEIDINNISKGSHIEITAICDICGKEKIMAYKDYNYNLKNNINNKYNCKICANKQSKKTMLKIWA